MFKINRSLMLLAPSSVEGGIVRDQVVSVPADTAQVAIPGEQSRGVDHMLGNEGEVLSDDDTLVEIPSDTNKKANDSASASQSQNIEKPKPKEVKVEAKIDTTKIEEKDPLTRAINEELEKKEGEVVEKDEKIVDVPDASKRDYSKIPKELQQVARMMPNPVFNLIKDWAPKIVKEATEAKAQLDQIVKDNGTPISYYEHSEGYQLNPQWNHSVQVFQRANFEDQQCDKAISELQKGAQKVSLLKGYNPDGSPVYTDVVVDDTNRAQLVTQLTNTKANVIAHKNTAQQQAQQIAQNHVVQNQQVVTTLKAKEDEYFPFYNPGTKNNIWSPEKQKSYDGFMEGLPLAVRHSPLASLLAKATLLIIDFNTDNKSLRARLKEGGAASPAAQAAETRAAGPTDTDAKGGKVDSGNTADNVGWEEESNVS